MARGIEVRISSAGARSVLTSMGVAKDLGARAIAIATAAQGMTSADKMRNAPFMADGEIGSGRARAVVFTSSTHGINSNNKHNALLKALDAGR